MKNLIKRYYDSLSTSDKSFEDRMLGFIAALACGPMIAALIGDIIIGESIVEIIFLSVAILMVVLLIPFRSFFMSKFKGATATSQLQALGLIFIVLPVTFFFGGGIEGGSLFWNGIIIVYIGIVLSGKWRTVMTVLLVMVTVAEYVIAYLYPELVFSHTREQFFIDSAVSCVLCALWIYGTIRFSKVLFRAENKRAQEETKRAEELNKSQSRFFSSMSHEIRTPINSILGLNEIILRQDNVSEEVKRDAVNIQGAGKMLLALVNDILDLSKIEAGKMDIIPVNYRVGDLVSEIVNMIWLRAEQKGLKFVVDIDPSIPSELYGDEVRIKQILINLLNNAVKYTKEGSVTLHMELEQQKDDKVQITFSVTDTGMGIKQEAIPYLFDAFQRVDQANNRKIEGTGLGLSIVKQLVDLMGGEISVNSVYSQGSTFMVSLLQSVANTAPVGDINISNFGSANTAKYECGFTAPDARILIVDDNEMNLEVEKKLLKDTKMVIDTVTSGEAALDLTLKRRYDVIFMDHLMPEMDGVEALGKIRKQTGGLNNMVPVIALTANAGSENKELYTRVGFDGYLVKPVAGAQLEECLIKHLPHAKVMRTAASDIANEQMNTAKGFKRKDPVIIASSSMSDIPQAIVQTQGIELIRFSVHTNKGTFWDNLEATSDELINYIKREEGRMESEPPSVEAYESFFAAMLKKAHHVIYISITSDMSEEYNHACEAAKNFDNVDVISSGVLSTSTGILVMIAKRLAERNMPVDKIIEELENVKKKIHCSFILESTEFMSRRGFVGRRTHKIMTTMNLRPSLAVKNNKFGVDKILAGNVKHCYEYYIKHALPRSARPDLDLLFVTYCDVSEEYLNWIEEEVRERYPFKHIVFQKASASISANCGPGTFGLLFIEKGKENYELGKMVPEELLSDYAEENFDDEEEEEDENGYGTSPYSAQIQRFEKTGGSAENAGTVTNNEPSGQGIEAIIPEKAVEVSAVTEKKWYDDIPGIDSGAGIRYSGSEEAFRSVIDIFYNSIDQKYAEIQGYFDAEDWTNYTVKVHALKSSAKLVGATDLSKHAEKAEMAGKGGDIDYIKQNHSMLMEEYKAYLDILRPLCENAEEDSSKPLADDVLLESVYEAVAEAAKDMDYGTIEETLSEMDSYRIPDSDREKFKKLKECFENLDYAAISELLS